MYVVVKRKTKMPFEPVDTRSSVHLLNMISKIHSGWYTSLVPTNKQNFHRYSYYDRRCHRFLTIDSQSAVLMGTETARVQQTSRDKTSE